MGHFFWNGWEEVLRLTGSELRGQEEAACACPANVTTIVLFTATNTEISKYCNSVILSTTA